MDTVHHVMCSAGPRDVGGHNDDYDVVSQDLQCEFAQHNPETALKSKLSQVEEELEIQG